ncbi:hypothetical protein ACIHEJ_39305 [Streptomyces sp. NPDC052301]|uniref:hypothetical protein n=1 Tax=Streptomyces sp. NPDC052301 TaxID=3365687 RepID=UPI0037D70EC2
MIEEAGAQAVLEAGRSGQQGAEDRDGEGCADLAAVTGFTVNPVVTSLAVRFAGDAPPSPRP